MLFYMIIIPGVVVVLFKKKIITVKKRYDICHIDSYVLKSESYKTKGNLIKISGLKFGFLLSEFYCQKVKTVGK